MMNPGSEGSACPACTQGSPGKELCFGGAKGGFPKIACKLKDFRVSGRFGGHGMGFWA